MGRRRVNGKTVGTSKTRKELRRSDAANKITRVRSRTKAARNPMSVRLKNRGK